MLFPILTTFVTSIAGAAPTVIQSGDCPGEINIMVDNITSGECIGVAWGGDAGGAGETVPRGDCTGTVMGLDPLHYAFSACDYDGDGSISFSPDISADACGTSFQILDMDSCEASDVERIALSTTSEYYDGPTTYDDDTDDYGESACAAAGGTDSWISDGYCDSLNNNLACDYDGGDCCEDTCVDGSYDCDTHGGCAADCLDPDGSDDACDTSSETSTRTTTTTPSTSPTDTTDSSSTTTSGSYYGTYDYTLVYATYDSVAYYGSYHTTDYGAYSTHYALLVPTASGLYYAVFDSGSSAGDYGYNLYDYYP